MNKNAKDSANNVLCWNKHKSPEKQLREMFVDIVQEDRIKLGQCPARRPVFLKPHGIAHGTFEVLDNISDKFKVGIFGQNKSYKSWIRFSSDTLPTSPDLKTTCGVAIKLFGVKGKKLLGDGETQDFILQNHDVFFVDTAQDMAEFTTAGVVDKDYDAYLKKHPETNHILKEMAKPVSSCLTSEYWGVLPYAFGKDNYVKYKLIPENPEISQPFDNNNYLTIDLKRRLLDGTVQFKFMVQFRTDSETMPLDRATVRWEENQSPFIQLATLTIPQQDITSKGQAEYGENLSYNPWHCLAEHEPQGSISLARKIVYAASANNRHKANGISLNEPTCPRSNINQQEQDDCIVSAAIHPSIGIARIGNSEDEYFIGPEVIDPKNEDLGFYRDKHGKLKRQAARFRIYGLNAKGEAVKELSAKNAQIEWGIHVANKKASWYQFQLALDIPEAINAPPSLLRNSNISDRNKLIIDAGYHKIKSKKPTKLQGKFMDNKVYLGEAKLDESGRLIVLGGYGKSFSFNKGKAVTFANNDGWCDDVSDGPITAMVKFKGVELKVDPAWLVVAPPNYGPMQKSVRTMWDLIRDINVQNKKLERPTRPSFQNDIKPIFDRMNNLQWVNAGFAKAFGWNGVFDFTSPNAVQILSDTSPIYIEQRRNLFNHFRNFDRDGGSPVPFPWIYGDAMNIPSTHSPRQHSVLSDLQMQMLAQWVNGDFINDYVPDSKSIENIEDLPILEQPQMLDRSSLEYCLADAFHPGCEMTWPMRNPDMYMSPFRIKHAPKGWEENNYGAELNQDVISLPNGPISGGQLPGGITRWMAVPWQTDTASCRSGYNKSYDPYVPTFWPARVPNEVLLEKDYNIVMNTELPLGDRMQAFANRANWLEPLNLDKGYTHQINEMIHNFDHLSVIENRSGPDDSNFPSKMQVAESTDKHHRIQSSVTHMRFKEIEIKDKDIDLTKIDKVRRFYNGKA